MIELLVSLVATVTALGVVVWSGITRRRTLHYTAVVAMLVLLGIAIWFAEQFGSKLEFTGTAGTVHTIHMGSVVLTFLALPLVAWTGLRLARAIKGSSAATGAEAVKERAGHRHSASVFVTLVVVTSILGALMTLLALDGMG